MGAQHRYIQTEFKKLEKWYGNYQQLWMNTSQFKKIKECKRFKTHYWVY